MAGPFEDNEYLRTIAEDKKLDPMWVRSLFERGVKQTYSDPKALARIGMPVGGLFAGTVYLSGDGRLWLWDIFNRDQEGILPRGLTAPADTMVGDFLRGGANYIHPAPLTQPFELGFDVEVAGAIYTVDSDGFSDVTFDGRYPVGHVAFRDTNCKVRVDLDAFSPFIPLNSDDSSLPATIMSYRVTNASKEPISGRLIARMANPICLISGKTHVGERWNRVIRREQFTAVEFSAQAARPIGTQGGQRPDIRFDDFEQSTYENWTVEGIAFGSGPVTVTSSPGGEGALGAHGKQFADSSTVARDAVVASRDGQAGKLVSRSFPIERHYISLLIGGASRPDQSCVNLLVEGKKAASLTGQSDGLMRRQSFRVEHFAGKRAQLEIVDAGTDPSDYIRVDDIVFTDVPLASSEIDDQPDFGRMTLTFLGGDEQVEASAKAPRAANSASGALSDTRLVGTISKSFKLDPGEWTTLNFLITWHFPNFYARGCGGSKVGHYYATRYKSAIDVAEYVADNFDRLVGDTKKWVETWYDSSLPYWLLDRTNANTGVLATTTCYRFGDGRLWAWEGIGCCEGTCTHVWHYAQALGRLFPEVERDTRTRIDFGMALHEDGGIGHRASLNDSMFSADDGQCGRILGVYREHQMSTDSTFLKGIWPRVKRAIEFLIRKDANSDGMIEDAQPNTLDAAWYGKISFLASLYIAALRAGEQMALEMDEHVFANQCRVIAERGAKSILETYNGEFFTQIEDPTREKEIGTGTGCYIDQVFGQTWAHWVALGTLFDRDRQLSALRALWKYNFVPDVGAFRDKFKRGRWYAMAGDAGLIMCSWPKGGQNPAIKDHWQFMYFNECMTGFEWQAAAHMIWEGIDQPDLLEKGLAVSRAIHDRYSAALRNPYNEIECSDHYARSMASYGVFQAVCGFTCHCPRGHVEFAPRLSPDNFRAAFVTSQGWGTFEQQVKDSALSASLIVHHGELILTNIGLRFGKPVGAAMINGQLAKFQRRGDSIVVTLLAECRLKKGDRLDIALL
jgi:uncharacterized protein (DUF608 family)